MNAVTSDKMPEPTTRRWDVSEAIIEWDDLNPRGQLPQRAEKSSDPSVETAMKQLSEQFTTAIGFIGELGQRIELLQNCVMTIEGIETREIDAALRTQMRAVLLVASSELLQAVRGLIIKTRVS